MSTLLEDDMPYIEYSFVTEPESWIVFEEKEYQQVQAVCSHCTDEIQPNNVNDCALKARRLRKRRMRNLSLSKIMYYKNRNRNIEKHNQQMWNVILKIYIININVECYIKNIYY